jgi:lipopolysaccharide export system protein LptC
MAETGINERKRGAPWIVILLLLVVAVAIGWWLWSSRSSGSPTTTPVADSTAGTTRTP